MKLTIRYAYQDRDKDFFRDNFLHDFEDRIHLMAVGGADETVIKNSYWESTFIGEIRGKVIGYVHVESHNANSCCRIEQLFILKKYRHKGYGTQLLKFAEQFISQNWDCRIIDCLTIENEAMEQLLQKNGYTAAGIYDHFFYKGGKWWSQSRWIK